MRTETEFKPIADAAGRTPGMRFLKSCGWTDEEVGAFYASPDSFVAEPTQENPRCDGENHFWVSRKGYPVAKPCDCHRKDPWALKLSKVESRLGRNYTWESFDAALQPKAFALADIIRKTWQAGAILIGPTGTGKTHLAKALVYEAIKQHKTADFIHVAYLARLFQKAQGFDDSAEEARRELEALKRVSVLVIDDLGSQRRTDSHVFEEQFQLFLDETQAALIITTNLSSEELDTSLGRKISSRIADRCARLDFHGKDQRNRKLADKLVGGEINAPAQ